MAVHQKQIAFVQLKPRITAFNVKKGTVCVPREIAAITIRFSSCVHGRNPTEDTELLLQCL